MLVLALLAHRTMADPLPGWKNLTWGDALARVREQYPAIQEMKAPDGSTSFLYLDGFDAEAGEFKADGKWRIEFLFSKSGGLKSVEFTIRNAAGEDYRIADRMREKLAIEYGLPVLDGKSENDSRSTIWRAPRAAIKLKWAAHPQIKRWAVSLAYSPLDNAAGL